MTCSMTFSERLSYEIAELAFPRRLEVFCPCEEVTGYGHFWVECLVLLDEDDFRFLAFGPWLRCLLRFYVPCKRPSIQDDFVLSKPVISDINPIENFSSMTEAMLLAEMSAEAEAAAEDIIGLFDPENSFDIVNLKRIVYLWWCDDLKVSPSPSG